jgi:hypothetical protein
MTSETMGKAWTIIHVDEGTGFAVDEEAISFILGEIQLNFDDGETEVYTNEEMTEIEKKLLAMEPGQTLEVDETWSVKCQLMDLEALKNGPEWGGW